MIVVLDANVILADPWLRGTQFGTLIDGLKTVGGTLAVPALVVDEVVTKYEETYEQARGKTISCWEELNKLSREEIITPTIKPASQAASEYREWLLARLAQISARILPIPDVPHQVVIARELSRKRPFRNGKGYRDYLIWETVLRTPGRVVFVTMNTSDFGEVGELHRDLAEDVERTAIKRDSFDVSWNLRAFNEVYILPRLQQLEEIRKRLEVEGQIIEWFKDNTDSLLVEEDLLIVGMGMPPGAGRAGLVRLKSDPEVEIQAVWEREPGRYLVRVQAELPVTFSADFDADDYKNFAEVRELLGPEDMPAGSSASLSDQENEFLVSMVFTIGGNSLRIVDWDIEQIDARYVY